VVEDSSEFRLVLQRVKKFVMEKPYKRLLYLQSATAWASKRVSGMNVPILASWTARAASEIEAAGVGGVIVALVQRIGALTSRKRRAFFFQHFGVQRKIVVLDPLVRCGGYDRRS
jgi:hypothetical protein